MLPDPYESLNVAVKCSKARGAGEGKSDVLKCRHHAQITIIVALRLSFNFK